MPFVLQPILQDEKVILVPLSKSDFEELYLAASDPLIWEQHPNPERYKRDVFETYFQGAIHSGGAFLIKEKLSGKIMGSSRFYDFSPETSRILIGYTFFARAYWGKNFNYAVKKLMLDHAFQFVDTVIFQIGANNIRSQRAIEKLGAIKVGEDSIAYIGETKNLNFVYQMNKSRWLDLQKNIPNI